MSNVNTYLKENLKKISKNVFVSPDIPEKKLNNAVKAFKMPDDYNYVIAIYDNTFLGSAKEGLVFTGEKVVYRPLLSDPETILYEQILSAEYIKNISVNDKGKEKKEEFIIIKLVDDKEIKLDNLTDCNYSELANLLNHLNETFNEYSNEDQLITLAEMPEEIRLNYLRIIVNMTLSNDGVIDSKEFSEIFLLMTRLNCSKEMRAKIREYMSKSDEIMSNEELISNIDSLCIPSHNKAIKISLVKDLLNVHMSINNGKFDDFPFLDKYQELLNITDKEKEFAMDAIKQDYQILNEFVSDSTITKNMKELSAKAGAVGVPIAAVYLSGSVVGMSAAGMTSGLATLGLGGILGFSSMATGIGVAVLLGVISYKGIRHLTGANEIDKYKAREMMLNEVLKQTQSTISILIEDINYISEKLNNCLKQYLHIKKSATETIEKVLEHENQLIKKLDEQLRLYCSAGLELNNKENKITMNKARIHCPSPLDINKLKGITDEPSKKAAYNKILEFYHEEQIVESKGDKKEERTAFILNEQISAKQIEELARIFNALGYFDVISSVKSSIKGFFNNDK